MKITYKTERLPQNFVILGYLLILAGVWIGLYEDWKGILFLLIGVVLVFIESGIIIDPAKQEIKRYTGIFFLKRGNWQSISKSTGLVVAKTQETQSMHVLSISRSVTEEVYKLWMVMPEGNIELMKAPGIKL